MVMPPVKSRLPCVCGNRLLQMWSGFGNCTIKCTKCGKEAYGRNQNDATDNWNKMVKDTIKDAGKGGV